MLASLECQVKACSGMRTFYCLETKRELLSLYNIICEVGVATATRNEDKMLSEFTDIEIWGRRYPTWGQSSSSFGKDAHTHLHWESSNWSYTSLFTGMTTSIRCTKLDLCCRCMSMWFVMIAEAGCLTALSTVSSSTTPLPLLCAMRGQMTWSMDSTSQTLWAPTLQE